MGLGEAILAVGAGERAASFEQFRSALDSAWVAAALAATDTASVRRRKLPAEHVGWLVIGMGLFHDRSPRSCTISTWWCCRAVASAAASPTPPSSKRVINLAPR